MFTPENSIFILIDVQGKLSEIVYESESVMKSLEVLIQGMNTLDVPILWMEQIPSKIGPTRESLAKLMRPASQPISKTYFSVCREKESMAVLEASNRKQVILAGIETHICVHQTACDLIDKGYEVQVVADCVSSRTRENREIGLKRIAQSGGKITSVEMLLFELMEKAEGDTFKNIARLVK